MKLYELTEQFLALQELVYDPEADFSGYNGRSLGRD